MPNQIADNRMILGEKAVARKKISKNKKELIVLNNLLFILLPVFIGYGLKTG
jgi:hypothetical protein